MQVIKSLTILLSILLITGCSVFSKPRPIETKVIPDNTIALAARPERVDLQKMKFHVVTEDNLQQFIQDFTNEFGQLTFVAISVKDYEKLAINTAELFRYIKEQKEIIIYYENAIGESKNIQTK